MKGCKLIILVLILSPIISSAQQDPLFSQYAFNVLAINPAYSGIKNQADVSFNSRFQWAGVDGSPTTNILTFNTSLMEDRGGLGAIFISDKIGIHQTNQGHLTYGYKVQIGDNQLLFGLQTGFVSIRFKVDDLTLRYFDDPFFSSGEQSITKINFGAGVFFKSDNLMIGFSIPKALNNDFSNTDFNGILYNRHYYFSAAYLQDINTGLKLKPFLLIRSVSGAPLSVNFNTNLIINNRYHVGLFTNNAKTLGALFQFEYNSRYKVGYSFEFLSDPNISSRLNSHEFFLNVSFDLFKNQNVFQHYF